MYRVNSSYYKLLSHSDEHSEIGQIIKRMVVVFPDFGEHILIKIKPKFDELINRIEEKIAGYYSGEGRPAYPIKTLLGMLLIQRLYNINSDRVISRICRSDIVARYFIGCGSFYDPIPDDTTLVKFRKRLGEEGFREVFDELVKLAEEAKKISNFRIIDATYMYAIGRKFSAIEFVRKGINKVIEGILTINKEVGTTLKEKFSRITIKTKRGAKKVAAHLIKEVSKFPQIVNQLPKHVRKVIPAMKLFTEGKPVVSHTDVEARWGYKTEKKVFGGYKAEIMATEDGFVTSWRILPGNVCEGKDISPLIEYETDKMKLRIEKIAGDALYSSGTNFAYLKREKITGYFPLRTRESKIDEFTLGEGKILCPMGKEPKSYIYQQHGKLFYWSAKDCKLCPNKGRCVSPSECRKKVYLSDLKSMKIEERRDKLKIRKRIESIFAHGVRHGIRNNWYIGLSKGAIHLALVFTLLNLEYLCR